MPIWGYYKAQLVEPQTSAPKVKYGQPLLLTKEAPVLLPGIWCPLLGSQVAQLVTSAQFPRSGNGI